MVCDVSLGSLLNILSQMYVSFVLVDKDTDLNPDKDVKCLLIVACILMYDILLVM